MDRESGLQLSKPAVPTPCLPQWLFTMVKASTVVGLMQTTIMYTKWHQIDQSSLARILHTPFQPRRCPTATASKAETETKRWKTFLEPSGQHQHPLEVLSLEGAADSPPTTPPVECCNSHPLQFWRLGVGQHDGSHLQAFSINRGYNSKSRDCGDRDY